MNARFALLTAAVMLGASAGLAAENTAASDAAGTQQTGNLEHGKQIFTVICSRCHHSDHTTSPVGAPGLQDVLDRHDEAWINEWISGPEAFSKKDPKAKALVDSNPYGLIMPTLPEMQNPQNRLDIIEFLKTLK